MVSLIDATKPVDGTPAVKSELRANLLRAKVEIEALQAAAPVSARNYGAVGNGTTDDTAAIQAALNTGFSVDLGHGNFLYSSPLTMTAAGQELYGDSPWTCVLEWAGASVNTIIIKDNQYQRVRDLMIRPKAGQPLLTAGYAVEMLRGVAQPLLPELCRVLIYGMFNGVKMTSVTEGVLTDVLLWALRGTRGVLFNGTVGFASYAATLTRLRTGGMETNTSIILVDQNSLGHSLRMDKCVLLYGGVGFRMGDDINNGTSYPLWCIGNGNECDHNQTGVSLQGGEGFNWTTSWIGSALLTHGYEITSTYRGEATLDNTRVMGNKQHGVFINGGVDNHIRGCQIGDNSVSTPGVYHGINIGANVSRFYLHNNRAGDLVGVAGNVQGYGVNIATGASDFYLVQGNMMTGNATGEINDGGTGLNKVVQKNTFTLNQIYADKLAVDINYYYSLSGGNPFINYDANDYFLYNRTTNRYSYLIAGVEQLGITDSNTIVQKPLMLASFTVATLPTASANTNAIIFVQNGTLNKRLAVSDGTNWRFPDGAIVS